MEVKPKIYTNSTNALTELLDLRKLKSFITVADRCSFSDAAKESLYTTSALSVQIKSLENTLGVTLFDRIGNKAVLTSDGEKLYKYASVILSINNQVFESFSNENELSGSLRIGSIDSICDSILPDLLADYHKHYPKVFISVLSYSPKTLLRMLKTNDVDIMLVLDNPIADHQFTISKCFSEDVIFCCSASSPIAKESNLSIDKLLSYPCLLTEKGESYRNNLEAALAKKKIYITPTIESKSTQLIIDLIKKNVGFSVLPRFIVNKEILAGEIVQLPFDDLNLSIDYQILYNNAKYISREMLSFIDTEKKFSYIIQTGKKNMKV